MAASKTKPKPVAPKPLLDPQFHADIEGIVKATTKTATRGADGVEIAADKLDRAIDLLSLTRALVRNTEADYKVRVKEIPDPFAPYLAEKKSIIKRAQEVEHDLEDGLHGLLTAGVLTTDTVETAAGCRLSLVGKRSLVIDDATLIPDEFLLPRAQCIDIAKLSEKMMACEEMAQVAAKAGIAFNVDTPKGVHFTTTYSFRTKLPDELGA
jgi:hypothetical protein